MGKRIGLISSVGQGAIAKVSSFHTMILLLYDMIVALIVRRQKSVPIKQLTNQILFIGVDALVLTLSIALVISIMMTFFSFENMDDFGASSKYGIFMVISMILELGPFVTAIVVVGRSGAAFTTFLANMKVTREIDALDSMGIDVVEYLVLPALLGMIFSLVALNFYFDMIALLGGVFFAKVYYGVSFTIYFRQIIDALNFSDIPLSMIKSTLFGVVIAVVSSYHGLVVSNLRIVPRAVYRSSVTSTSLILLINILISVVYYGIRSKLNGH